MDGNSHTNGNERDESIEAIKIGQMPQQNEVREPDDDWTGLNDPKARRKLQNRLNQRLWSKRELMTLLDQRNFIDLVANSLD